MNKPAQENSAVTTCGYVAIIGRPNVGKSTLLNKIIGQKISITARKAQTTRHKILGIKTRGSTQIVYIDTPGVQRAINKRSGLLSRAINKAAWAALFDVDVIVFVVQGTVWGEEDEWICAQITKRQKQKPVILAINKVDEVVPRERLLPHIDKIKGKMEFAAIVPIAARVGTNLDKLEQAIIKFLPESPFFYYAEQITDQSQEVRVAEIIREKIVRLLGQELPYVTAVQVDSLVQEEKLVRIEATIFVAKAGQKAIIIGRKGAKLKQIGTLARQELEKMFGRKVFLSLWVKVKEKWIDDKRMLKKFGYE